MAESRELPPVGNRTAMADVVARNPGPAWGYRFLLTADRLAPRWLLRPLLQAGTWVAVAVMPGQRRNSRAFLSTVLGHPVGIVAVWRHFFAFLDFLLVRIRAAHGAPPPCTVADPDAAVAKAFEGLLESDEPAFFGTFHFGYSELLGFLLGRRNRRVAMIRRRVGNSEDTRWLGREFGEAVSFIWSNEPADLPFQIKAAVESGASVAMQCDRLESSSRSAGFEFLGARRLFPFTIYHLAVLFDRPVAFCIAVPRPSGAIELAPAPIFRPDQAMGREANLNRAREHFQDVLGWLETRVRQDPRLWFNFLPLNPQAPPASALT
ncbi:MAG TPA: hypothetical protein VHE61_20790 [Opitutaceae bacterium]|nr:hypothetical protein [Opitutaceae bacterium]